MAHTAAQTADSTSAAGSYGAAFSRAICAAAGKFDRWAFTEFALPLRSLAVFRIIYAAAVLLIVVPRGLSLYRIPSAFYHAPFSVAMFWTAQPSAAVVQWLNLGLIVSLAALLLGWQTRVASVGVTLLLILLHSFMYAYGKINHGHLLLILVPGVLAWSGWGRALSIDSHGRPATDSDRYTEAWGVSLLAFLVAVAMFTAGWPKLITGWLDLSTQATLGHLMRNNVYANSSTWAGTQAMQWFPLWLWECMDWATVLLECGFLLVLWNRRLFRLMCAVACLFHLGVLLIFSINFYGNLLAYAAFVDWHRIPLPARVQVFFRQCGRLLSRVPPLLLLVLVAGGFTYSGLIRRRSIVSLLEFPVGPVLITTGAIVAMAYLGRELWQVIHRQSAAAESLPLATARSADADTLRKSA